MKINKEHLESFYNYLMLIGILAIFLSGALAYHEFKGAKRFCDEIDGDYSVELFPLPFTHYCNENVVERYTDGWDFISNKNMEINLSLIYP